MNNRRRPRTPLNTVFSCKTIHSTLAACTLTLISASAQAQPSPPPPAQPAPAAPTANAQTAYAAHVRYYARYGIRVAPPAPAVAGAAKAAAPPPPGAAPAAAGVASTAGQRATGWTMPRTRVPAARTAPAPAQSQSPQPYGYGQQYWGAAGVPAPSDVAAGDSAATDSAATDRAATDRAEPPFFDTMLGTQVPLSVGVLISLELPGRLLLQGEMGWMPKAYGSVIGGILSNFPAYTGATERVVNAMLSDAVVGRVSGGWRPFPAAGFEITGGYTMISLGGSASGNDLADIVGDTFADQYRAQIANTVVTVDARLHNVHVGLGWRFVALDDHLVVRASLAYLQTVAVDTDVSISDQPEIERIAQQTADTELGTLFVDYVKLPVVGLNAGYRF